MDFEVAYLDDFEVAYLDGLWGNSIWPYIPQLTLTSNITSVKDFHTSVNFEATNSQSYMFLIGSVVGRGGGAEGDAEGGAWGGAGGETDGDMWNLSYCLVGWWLAFMGL